jgi:hypothetical protein
MFTTKGIYRLKLRTLGKLLESRSLPPLDARFAILAYGSNACPDQLLNKNLTDVPVLYGRLTGAEAVYAGRKTEKGYVPATLARKNGSRSSWVTLLTRDQLQAMNTSEGRHHNTYALAELSKVRFSVGRSRFIPLYTYVRIRGGVMTGNGKSVSLRSTSQKRAKQLLAAESWEDAARWLDYEVIPHPSPPANFSQILRQ